MNLIDITNEVDIFKEQRNELSSKCDKLFNVVDNIKNKYHNLNLDFKKDFNQTYPFILEYKDKIEYLYEESQKRNNNSFGKKFYGILF
jgi:hypothetical protein